VEAITGAATVPHMLADLDHAVEATQVNHINPWEGRSNKPATERTRKTKLDRKPSRQKDATGPISCRPQQFQSHFGIFDVSSEDAGICEGESMAQHVCIGTEPLPVHSPENPPKKTFQLSKCQHILRLRSNFTPTRVSRIIHTNQQRICPSFASALEGQPWGDVVATGAAIDNMVTREIPVIVVEGG
jgi:hypothetical protein